MTQVTGSNNYEENFSQLKKVVEQLEQEALGLEDSLNLFEEGIKLVTLCDSQLSEVEKRVKVLISGEESLTPRADIPLQPVSADQPLEN